MITGGYEAAGSLGHALALGHSGGGGGGDKLCRCINGTVVT